MSKRSFHWGTLLLAVALSLCALLLGALDLWHAMADLADGRVTSNVLAQVRSSPVTMHRLYAFVAKVLFLHVALGVLAWLACELTVAARSGWLRYRYYLVVAWFMWLNLGVGMANASLYPWSKTGSWFRVIHGLLPRTLPAWQLMMLLAALVVLGLAVFRIRHLPARRQVLRAAVWGVLVLAAIPVLRGMPVSGMDKRASGRPNIIFIGVDSLRPGLVASSGSFGYTPSLSNFAEGGARFTDAVTPLARTYPSWMALLSGRRPAHSGIRENLMPRDKVKVTTLADRLATLGYKTVYATDEVRFSNIDTSYGFEQVLTPRIGASDFMLASLNDLPLTNVLANTVVGKWLFPETYANRAAAVTYEPDTFVDRLQGGVRPDGRPMFLAMHLTLPHWPYRWRADEGSVFAPTAQSTYGYLSAVVAADRQFHAVMQLLDRKGLLENTLVVVFSDHGEGLNLKTDSLARNADRSSPIGVPVWTSGHGTSVLSGSQFQILLAARAYGIPGMEHVHGEFPQPVSIEDIAPTVLDLLGVMPAAGDMDGRSFAHVLRQKEAIDRNDGMRIRFTESAYSTPSLRQGAADEASLLQEGSDVFHVNPVTGWVEIRADLWAELLAVRERAAIGPTQILAAIPHSTPGSTIYALVSRTGGRSLRLDGPPDPSLGEEASLLWTALHREYAGELGAPAP